MAMGLTGCCDAAIARTLGDRLQPIENEEEESAAEFFPEAAWQRCVVHWYRNIFSHVPSTKVREIAAMLKAIHASEDVAAAREKAVRVIEKLRSLRLTRAAELVEAAVEETLTYYAFPEEHWRRVRTNVIGSGKLTQPDRIPAVVLFREIEARGYERRRDAGEAVRAWARAGAYAGACGAV